MKVKGELIVIITWYRKFWYQMFLYRMFFGRNVISILPVDLLFWLGFREAVFWEVSDFATVTEFFSTYGTAGPSSWIGIGSSAISVRLCKLLLWFISRVLPRWLLINVSISAGGCVDGFYFRFDLSLRFSLRLSIVHFSQFVLICGFSRLIVLSFSRIW